eukprot:maker-scaffold650_size119502-snap-gene-0.18 protein:Tk04727 transcript:maker-scaffold650_size119502-snap-gene-0.18-mRNA-1 annotation:"malto-oligosyltrehalose synthase"
MASQHPGGQRNHHVEQDPSPVRSHYQADGFERGQVDIKIGPYLIDIIRFCRSTTPVAVPIALAWPLETAWPPVSHCCHVVPVSPLWLNPSYCGVVPDPDDLSS